MKNEKLLLFLLAVVQFTHIIDFMIVMPLGKQLMEIFVITPFQFTAIVSSYAIAAGISSFFSAMFIDRFDRRKALVFIYFWFAVSTLACSIAPSFLILLIARSLTGVFGGVISALILSIVADAVPLERRGMAMGIIMTAFSVASVLGVPVGLWLAAKFDWWMPFASVGVLSLAIIPVIMYYIPPLRAHLDNDRETVKPFKVIKNIVSDRNQLSALTFSFILIFAHFLIIPFIAPYMQINVGFSDFQITYIYLVGGILTAVLLPLFGRLSDIFGHVNIFTIASIAALFSIFAITNLPAVSILLALCATSSYFVVASGRNVPATTMVTSVVQAESRAGFLSVRASVNQIALFLSSLVAGAIVGKNSMDQLTNYEVVGYLAMIMSVIAILIARRLKLKT